MGPPSLRTQNQGEGLRSRPPPGAHFLLLHQRAELSKSPKLPHPKALLIPSSCPSPWTSSSSNQGGRANPRAPLAPSPSQLSDQHSLSARGNPSLCKGEENKAFSIHIMKGFSRITDRKSPQSQPLQRAPANYGFSSEHVASCLRQGQAAAARGSCRLR